MIHYAAIANQNTGTHKHMHTHARVHTHTPPLETPGEGLGAHFLGSGARLPGPNPFSTTSELHNLGCVKECLCLSFLPFELGTLPPPPAGRVGRMKSNPHIRCSEPGRAATHSLLAGMALANVSLSAS